MTSATLLSLAILCIGAAIATGALGPYVVGSALARVLVAIVMPTDLLYPTLAVTALVDGALLYSFLRAAAEEPRSEPAPGPIRLATALARSPRGPRTARTSLPCG
jgi:hypothetical protein